MTETQQQEFKPDEAVSYLANFGHDPEALKGQEPDQLKGIYEKTTGFINSQIETKLKETPVIRDGWREHLAGEDKDALKTLQRFTDPQQLWKRTQELTKKLSSGELKAVTPFPKDGKPEEQDAWRTEHGIPAKPEAYMEKLALKEGLVIGDEDKPFVDSYLATAHAANLPPEVVNEQLNWYLGTYIPDLQKAQAEMDGEFKVESQVKLREAWGQDYKGNMNAVATLLGTAPEGLRDRFFSSRTPEGRAFGDDPDVMQWLAGLARELNPTSTVTGGTAADPLKGVNDKIAEYEKMMKDNRQAWNKDIAGQAEYQKLLDLRSKHK